MPLVQHTPVLPPEAQEGFDPVWWFNRIVAVGVGWFLWRAIKTSR
jgi:hypothetical protein